MVSFQVVTYAFALLLPAVYLIYRHSSPASAAITLNDETEAPERPLKTIMQPPREDLAPPKDDPFTLEELKRFDGTNEDEPIYVSIKGTVFDVSSKKDTYGPGKSYNVFAGKDGSKGLGMSSLKPEDAIPDYSELSESDRKVLDDWHGFFSKRYNIVGRVIDHPCSSV